MFNLDNKVYDALKWVCMLFLPAASILVKTICTIWDLPLGNEISLTITAVNVFLASILGISHIQYKNGADTDGNQNE